MKTTIIAACVLACLATAAEARTRHHHRAPQIAAGAISEAGGHRGSGGGLITVSTAAGPVTVAPSFAQKIVPFIADVVARGFRGRVNCYANKGHVSGSLHYRGQACDFAQRGWGKTVAPMYHVADLAAKHGLRDGCSFRDCGHIDSGQMLARVHRHRAPQSNVYAEAQPMADRSKSW